MKVGTKGFLRTIKGIWDYFVFYEIKLAQSQGKMIFYGLLYFCAIAATLVLSDRFWHVKWLSFIVYLTPVFAFLWKKFRADYRDNPRFEKNEALRQLLNGAIGSTREHNLGFRTLASTRSNKVLFESAINISREFNNVSMFNRNVDWPLIKDEGSKEYQTLIEHLRKDANLFLPFGRSKLWKSTLDGKTIINETKIAFKSDFPPKEGQSELHVYKTDYFTGLLSAERSIEDANVTTKQGQMMTVSSAQDRNPFWMEEKLVRLPNLHKNSVPVSQQFGIEIIGLTRDKIFRIPFQSQIVEFSKGKRIPLATGSMDWEDAENATSLKELIVNAAKRELIEEWGSRPGKAGKDLRKRLAASKYVPMGYYRQVLRAGKPQFVCLVYLDCDDNELFADQSEVMLDLSETSKGPLLTPKIYEKVNNLKMLETRVRHILTITSPKGDSVALFGAAQSLLHAIQDNPEQVKDILELD